MHEILTKYPNLLIWIAVLCLYYSACEIWTINVNKRFLVYAAEMICILCLTHIKLDSTMTCSLVLLMTSHWIHWLAWKHWKALESMHVAFELLVVLGCVDVLLMIFYNNLDDDILKIRFTVEQCLLMINVVHTMRIFQTSDVLPEECEHSNQTTAPPLMFFEAFELLIAIYIFLSYWPTVGLTNLLYRIKSFSVAMARFLRCPDAFLIAKAQCQILQCHDIFDILCIICRKTMRPTNRCGWVRLPCGHSCHTCCAAVWFNFQFICPSCGFNIVPELEPPEAQMNLHRN